MSEKEKTVVELKEEDRDLLRSAIEAVKGGSKSAAETEPTGREHETIEEAVACPDCYPKIRDLVLKKHREETKDSRFACKECGTRVKQEWKNCPTCGSEEAEEV